MFGEQQPHYREEIDETALLEHGETRPTKLMHTITFADLPAQDMAPIYIDLPPNLVQPNSVIEVVSLALNGVVHVSYTHLTLPTKFR